MGDITEPSPGAAAPADTTAPAAAAPAAGHGWFPWLDQAPPELRSHAALKDMDKPGKLVQAYIDLAAQQERAVIFPDPEKATQEEIGAFYKKMGIPAEAKEYKLELGKFAELPGAKDVEAKVRETAAKAGLTNTQAQRVMGGILEMAETELKTKRENLAKQELAFDEAVLRDVGGDKGKATAFKNLYQAYLVRLESKGLIEALRENGSLYDPKMARKMAELEALYADDFQAAGGRPLPAAQPAQVKQNTSGRDYGFRKGKEWDSEHPPRS